MFFFLRIVREFVFLKKIIGLDRAVSSSATASGLTSETFQKHNKRHTNEMLTTVSDII